MARKRNLASVLNADLSTNMPLSMLADLVRSQGRGRDTVLAHITPREAAKLKREGGRGSINPATGLPEFDDGFDFAPPDIAGGGYSGAGDSGAAVPAQAPAGDSGAGAASAGGADIGGGAAAPAPQYQAAAQTYTPSTGQVAPTWFGGPATQAPTTLASPGAAWTPLADPNAPADGGEKKAPAAGGGFFGNTSALKLGLGALGLGIGGFNVLRGQQQAKAIQDAYNQAAATQRASAAYEQALAQPGLTQAALLRGLGAQGALDASRQQQLDAARARIAQSLSGQGGAVAATQAETGIQRMRDLMVANEIDAGNKIFDPSARLIDQSVATLNNAISNELQGMRANIQMSDASASAFGNLVTNLSNMFGKAA
jgi:hypothetical protein